MERKKFYTIVAMIMMIFVIVMTFAFSKDKDLQKEVIQEATKMTQDIIKYEMTEEEVKELPSTEIIEQTEEHEK